MPPNPSRLLGQTEAAELLGIVPDTLRLWRYQGRGPAYVRVGRSIRYRRADLDRYIRERTVDPEGVAS